MNIFSITFDLASGSDQMQIIQVIQSNGGKAIQTSSGLCVKSPQSQPELKAMLAQADLGAGISLQELDADAINRSPKDVQAFVNE